MSELTNYKITLYLKNEKGVKAEPESCLWKAKDMPHLLAKVGVDIPMGYLGLTVWKVEIEEHL